MLFYVFAILVYGRRVVVVYSVSYDMVRVRVSGLVPMLP